MNIFFLSIAIAGLATGQTDGSALSLINAQNTEVVTTTVEGFDFHEALLPAITDYEKCLGEERPSSTRYTPNRHFIDAQESIDSCREVRAFSTQEADVALQDFEGWGDRSSREKEIELAFSNLERQHLELAKATDLAVAKLLRESGLQ